jgi:homoserine O-acetyltransferase/O-succinyltransferase
MPTFFGGGHRETESMINAERALDPTRYFIVVPNMLGNGLSTSPSTTGPPFDGPSFPNVSVLDNVRCQHRLLTEHLGIGHVRLVVGYSMGAQQTFHWGVLYPDFMNALVPICGTARTSTQNALLLQGAKAALTMASDFADGRYKEPPTRGLHAFSRVHGSLVACSDFYREREYEKLGFGSAEETMRFFEGFFSQRDANDLLASLWTWVHADISANEIYNSDMAAALASIKARTVIIASAQDLLFPLPEIRIEVAQMPNAELRTIESSWGHLAGFGANPPDNEFIDSVLNELLGSY